MAAVVTAALAFLLIPEYEVEGAAIASAAGYAVGGALAWILFRRVARSSRRTPSGGA